jgi:hypothetical protein
VQTGPTTTLVKSSMRNPASGSKAIYLKLHFGG